jgi:ketosteroid isomerase-like protein
MFLNRRDRSSSAVRHGCYNGAMSTSEHDAEINAFADAFIGAILDNDVDHVVSMYTEDATVWHNFDEIDQTPAQNAKTLRALHRLIPGFRYEDIRRTVLPDGFWQQHVLCASAANGEMRIPAALRITMRDGRISRLEEYLDPAPFAAATGR